MLDQSNAESYDIEVYKALFCCVVEDDVYYINQIKALRKRLSDTAKIYVGYNILSYDNVVLGFLFWLDDRGIKATHAMLYNLSKHMIDETKPSGLVEAYMEECVSTYVTNFHGEKRKNYRLRSKGVWANDINFCDLYMVGEKKGGLKRAAVILDVDDLSETPIPFDQETISTLEAEEIVKYCRHDVKVTKRAYAWYKYDIATRLRQAELAGSHAPLTKGSAALAQDYFVGIAIKEHGARAKLVFDQFREQEGIIPKPMKLTSLVKQGRPPVQDAGINKFLDKISKFTVDFAHNPFENIETWSDEDGEDYSEWRKDDHKPTMLRCDGKAVRRGELVIEDDREHEYQFGMGGLHDNALRGVWRSNATHVIKVADVKSYYPSLIVAHNIHPSHFKSYPKYMKNTLDVRFAAKADKTRQAEADALKLAANASFGKMKDRYSLLYDPRAHFAVTLSGQVGLLYLVDLIYRAAPSAQIINTNTDGITSYMLRSDVPAYEAACKEWEQFMETSKTWA